MSNGSNVAIILNVKMVGLSPHHCLKSPVLIRILHQHGVEVLGVAGDLFAKPGRLVKRFVLIGELHFGDGQAVVVAIELIHFPSVFPVGVLHKITSLVDHAGFTDLKELLHFLDNGGV